MKSSYLTWVAVYTEFLVFQFILLCLLCFVKSTWLFFPVQLLPILFWWVLNLLCFAISFSFFCQWHWLVSTVPMFPFSLITSCVYKAGKRVLSVNFSSCLFWVMLVVSWVLLSAEFNINMLMTIAAPNTCITTGLLWISPSTSCLVSPSVPGTSQSTFLVMLMSAGIPHLSSPPCQSPLP